MLRKFFNNTRKPEGTLGKIMVGMMNGGHKSVANWGRTFINLKGDEVILDIGCGGGANIKEFLKLAKNSIVYGIDYSDISVEKSIKLNKKDVLKGKCIIKQANVLKLPFENDTFDFISAFETIYFWPEIHNSLKEVYRTLKKGGIFFITNEAYDNRQEKWTKIIDGMKIYSPEEIKKLLVNAGFTVESLNLNTKKGWISVVAKK